MCSSNLDVVADDGQRGDDLVEKQLPPRPSFAVSDLDVDAEFGNGDRCDSRFVVVSNVRVEIDATRGGPIDGSREFGVRTMVVSALRNPIPHRATKGECLHDVGCACAGDIDEERPNRVRNVFPRSHDTAPGAALGCAVMSL